jgi:hypothetical protein
MSAGVMQCEDCWLRIIIVYVRLRKPQQGAQMCHTPKPSAHLPNPHPLFFRRVDDSLQFEGGARGRSSLLSLIEPSASGLPGPTNAAHILSTAGEIVKPPLQEGNDKKPLIAK